MAALMGRPILAPGTCQDDIQAVLEQQMGGAYDQMAAACIRRTSSTNSTSNILELACASIGIDEESVGEDAGPSTMEDQHGTHGVGAASIIDGPSCAISSGADAASLGDGPEDVRTPADGSSIIMDQPGPSRILEDGSPAGIELQRESVIQSIATDASITSAIDSVVLNNTSPSPIISDPSSIPTQVLLPQNDLFSNILRGLAAGQSINDAFAAALSGFCGPMMPPGPSGVILKSPIPSSGGSSIIVNNSMGSIVSACSTNADEAVFKVPQLPKEVSWWNIYCLRVKCDDKTWMKQETN